MVIQIPNKLQQKGIKFVLLEKGGKKPFQLEWQNKIIEFNNPELIEHLNKGGNYGVMGGGEKMLLVIDFDNEKVQNEVCQKLPSTFTIKTGSGKLHKYFYSDKTESFKIFNENMDTLADVQGEGKQVVGAGSIHPNGNKYEVVEDVDITFLPYSEIKALLIPYDKKIKKEKKEYEKPKGILTEDFLDKLKSNVSIEDVLNSFGYNTSRNPTECPFHSSKGGKCLGFTYEIAHCFHCIHPEQEIFTLGGLKKVSEVNEGDITINALGERVKISKITKHKFTGEMLNFYVNGNKTPLKITNNHQMYYYKDIRCSAKYRKENFMVCKEECPTKRDKRCKLWKNKSFEIIGKIDAKEITTNDALFFPIPKIEKNLDFLDVSKFNQTNHLGKKRKRILKIPLTKEFLWVIGMYLAEGNKCRGGIKFLLNKKETKYAKRIIKEFNKIGINGSTFNQKTNSGESLLVNICVTDLKNIFSNLFGDGCQNKKIPRELLDLPIEKCKWLLQGVLDGDGSTKDGITFCLSQTSKQLMMDCYELGLKVGFFPSTSLVKKIKDKKQIYYLYLAKKGFGKSKIKNNLILLIKEIKKESYSGEVYDITVSSNHHSLLTPQGIIGNCDGSWNIFSLVKDIKKCDFKEALEYLANISGMEDELETSKRNFRESLKETEEYKKKELLHGFLELTTGKDKNWSFATELLVKFIKERNYFYTIKDDIKSEVWIYRDGIYIPQGRTEIKIILRDILKSFYSQYISGLVIAKIETDTAVDALEFFSNNYKDEVPLKNGLLNLFTRELKPFTHEKIFFNKLPVFYNPSAKCPQIEKFLNDILPVEEDKEVFYELGGFCLYNEYNFEKAFMFVGSGRNGKDKSLELIKRTLGIDNCSSIPLTSLEPDSFVIGELFGKKANLAGDISGGDLKDVSMFKALTGRSLISARRKFLNNINFVNYAKFIFACNELPMVYDNSRGFWDRWVLLEFPFCFVPKEEYEKSRDKSKIKIRDENIIERISTEEELSGLFNKFLEGLVRLTTFNGFSSTKGTEEIKTLWVRKSNSFVAFCWDFLEEDYDKRIPKKELRKKYTDYCKKHKITPKSDYVIKRALEENFGAIEGSDGTNRFWEGVRFKRIYEDEENEENEENERENEEVEEVNQKIDRFHYGKQKRDEKGRFL